MRMVCGLCMCVFYTNQGLSTVVLSFSLIILRIYQSFSQDIRDTIGTTNVNVCRLDIQRSSLHCTSRFARCVNSLDYEV